MRLVFKLHQNF